MPRMLKLRFPALVLSSVVFAAGCGWFGRGSDQVTPEKLYTDKPCKTECCCKTKKGYYVYFRCLDRVPCEQGGGTCDRPDIARCGE